MSDRKTYDAPAIVYRQGLEPVPKQKTALVRSEKPKYVAPKIVYRGTLGSSTEQATLASDSDSK